MDSNASGEFWYRHYQHLTLAPPTAAVFVHDFVRVDLPLDAVVGAFAYFVSPELLANLVGQAWRSELAEAGRVLRTDERAKGSQPGHNKPGRNNPGRNKPGRNTAESDRPAGAKPDDDLAVKVRLSPGRPRLGSLIVSVSWHSGSDQWLPPLDADLELTSFGPDRTHIHVMGMSGLAPGTMAGTDRASLDHRLSVALVRHVLVSLAETLTSRLNLAVDSSQ